MTKKIDNFIDCFTIIIEKESNSYILACHTFVVSSAPNQVPAQNIAKWQINITVELPYLELG